MSTITNSFTATTLEGKVSQGTATVRTLSGGERTLTAFKRLGAFWLIAALFIPVPIIHFVVPPVFLIIGMVAFIHALMTATAKLESAQVTCPQCGNSFPLQAGVFKPQRRELCPNCRHQITIRFASDLQLAT